MRTRLRSRVCAASDRARGAGPDGYWAGIARNWIAGKNHSATLEEDLARHFAEGVVVAGAYEQPQAELDEILAGLNFKIPEEYCLQAARGSICVAAERSNPKADARVRIFLTLESRALDEETAASRLPLLISAGHAATGRASNEVATTRSCGRRIARRKRVSRELSASTGNWSHFPEGDFLGIWAATSTEWAFLTQGK
jgi:hypothetical protein